MEEKSEFKEAVCPKCKREWTYSLVKIMYDNSNDSFIKWFPRCPDCRAVVCPKCGSGDVDVTSRAVVREIEYKYTCKSCSEWAFDPLG